MSKVEQRVIELKFDNDQFERAVATTMASLDALNKSLAMKGAVDGINGLTKAADGVNLGNIEDGVNHIASAFSAMGAIAFTVLQNLTNKAIAFGQSLIGKVLDPIFQGGLVRAENIEQAKFQFEGLGIDVTQAMASAKEAVLGTAYGLDSAAKAAAMFGASGLQAGPQMTSALRAIAGVAAITGSQFDDIANIFTTISGNGRVMSQELLQFSARGINAAAILAKQLGKTEEEVRQMVTDGKVSFQTFYTAMDAALGAHAKDAGKLFSGAMSNVHAALARLGADIQTPKLDAMRDILNAWIPVIDGVHAALMPAINALGQLDGIISANAVDRLKHVDLTALKLSVPLITDAITLLGAHLLNIARPIQDAFKDIFPEPTVAQIVKIATAIDDFAKKLKVSSTTANEIRRTFAGLFAVLDIGLQIIFQVGKLLGRLFGVLFDGTGNLLSVTAKVGDFLVALDKAIKHGTALALVFQYIGDALVIPLKLIHALTAAINALFSSTANIDTSGIDKAVAHLDPMTRFTMVIEEVWGHILLMLKAAFGVFGPLGDKALKFFEGMAKSLINAFSGANYSQILDSINTGLFAGFLVLLTKFETQGVKFGTNNIRIVAQLGTAFTQLTRTLSAMQVLLKAETLVKLALAIGLLTISVVALSLIDSGRLTKSLAAITVMMGQLLGVLALFERASGNIGVLKMQAIGVALILVAIAVDILVIAVAELGKLSWEQLTKGLIGLAVILGVLAATVKLMPPTPGLIGTAIALGILAVGVRILIEAVAELGKMDMHQLVQGLIAVGAVLLELALFSRFAKADPASALSGVGILLLAVAMRVLADAMLIFAKMNIAEIGKSLLVLGGALILIGVALSFIPPSSVLSAAGILIVAASLGLIGDALKKFATMNITEIGKSMLVLFGALLLIGLAISLIPPTAPLSAAGILIVALALGKIGDAMKQFGSMNMGEIGKSMLVLFGALLLIGVALSLIPPSSIVVAAAILILAEALKVILTVVKTAGSTDTGELVKGLIFLAAAFVLLGVAAAVLSPVLPEMMLLGVALTLIGLGLALAGAGVFLFAAGLTALSVAGAAGSTAIVAMASAVISLIPTLVEALIQSLGLLIDFIIKVAPKIAELLATIAVLSLVALANMADPLGKAILALLTMLLNILIAAIPLMVDAGYKILIGILTGIANNIGGVVTAATSIIVNFLNAIGNNLPRIIDAGFNLIINFINGLTNAINQHSAELGTAGANLAMAIVQGMANGLWSGVGTVVDAAIGVAKAALHAAKHWLGIESPSKEFMKVGMFSMMGFALGISQHSTLVSDAATGVGEDAVTALKDSLSQVSDIIAANVDTNPTITPVLDLTQFKKDSLQINSALAATPLSVTTSFDSAKAAAVAVQQNQDLAAANAAANASGTTVNLTQNNTSPAALDDATIYRQTNNLLNTVKGGVPANA